VSAKHTTKEKRQLGFVLLNDSISRLAMAFTFTFFAEQLSSTAVTSNDRDVAIQATEFSVTEILHRYKSLLWFYMDGDNFQS
jgi:hypothetical protein